jgi:hypothetical protein
VVAHRRRQEPRTTSGWPDGDEGSRHALATNKRIFETWLLF